jgi:hypothetical protein
MKFVSSKPNHAIIDFAQPVALQGWIVLLGIVLTPMKLKALVVNTTTLAGSAGTTVTTGVTALLARLVRQVWLAQMVPCSQIRAGWPEAMG